MVISGLKLITHNATGVNNADDPSLPFRLDAIFRPPEFMEMAFILMHGGSERITVRGETKEALEQLIEVNEFRTHP